MAFNPNLPVAKVTYEGDTLIDLTSDTVTADKLITGYTAHNAAGQQITGIMAMCLPRAVIDNSGNVTTVPTVADLHISDMVNVGSGALYYFQMWNTSLTEVANFSSLITVAQNGLAGAFYNCRRLTGASFPLLQTIGNGGLGSIFYNCISLTGEISFPSLTSLHTTGLNKAFYSCTLITALNFPIAIQAQVEAATGYDSNFGATNATINFIDY